MDELELLKKDWKKQDAKRYPKLSYQDIYNMLLKKSSSIVKWLFYISVAELFLWIALNFLPHFYSEEYKQRIEALYNDGFVFQLLSVISILIIITFIYLLYQSYKRISVTDNAKRLMENILRTRKIVRYYVIYNLIIGFLSIIVAFPTAIKNDPKAAKLLAGLSNTEYYLFMTVNILIMTIAIVVILLLFYRLIYGILLKRLKNNYNELKQLEV